MMKEINIFKKKCFLISQFRLLGVYHALFFGMIGIVLNTIEPFKSCNSLRNLISN